jgi:hypothetical protein
MAQSFSSMVVNELRFQGMAFTSYYLEVAVTTIVSMLVSSVLFLVVFWVLKLFFAVVLKLIYKSKDDNIHRFSAEKAHAYDRNPKAWGAVTGAISGLLATIIAMAPITGTMHMANKIIDIVHNCDRNAFAAPEVKKDIDTFKLYANDGVSNMLYYMGGNLVYSASASTMLYGETVYAVNEIENMELLVDDFLTIYPLMASLTGVTQEHIDAIDSLCVHIEESKIMDILMMEFLPPAARAWMNGELYMNIPRPAMNDIILPAFNGMLEICAYSDMYNVKDNLTSILRIYSILLSSGILQLGDDLDAIMNCIEQNDLIAKIDAEIDKNPNMAVIKTYTAEMAMRTIADKIYIDMEAISDSEYVALTEKLADAIRSVNLKGYGTMEERVSAMTSYAQEYLGDYGVSIPMTIAAPVAEIMLTRIDNGYDVSAEDIQNFIKGYVSN